MDRMHGVAKRIPVRLVEPLRKIPPGLLVPPPRLPPVILRGTLGARQGQIGHIDEAGAGTEARQRRWRSLPLSLRLRPVDRSFPHLSKLRNPLIAETFHRTGAVEIWGRGTNRVIEACKRHGLEPPTFEEQAGTLVVTFKAEIGPGAATGPSRDQVGTKSALSEEQTTVLAAAKDSRSMLSLMERCGRTNRSKFRTRVLKPLIDAGLLAMTIPDKPTSSRQRYRTTVAGARLLGRR